MKKTLELAWGVIRRPAPTFRRIKEEKPLGRGILVTLVPLVIVFSVSILRKLWMGIETFIPLMPVPYLHIVAYTALFNFMARMLKKENRYKSLLSANFFIFAVVATIGYLITEGISSVTNWEIGKSLALCQVLLIPWSLSLLILALREVYKITTLKAMAIFGLTLLLTLPLFIVTIPNFYTFSLPLAIVILGLLICSVVVLIFKKVLLGSLIRKKILYSLSLFGSLFIVLLIAAGLNMARIPGIIMTRYCISPQSIAIDEQSNIYVTSLLQPGSIFKFNSSGKFLESFRRVFAFMPQVITDSKGMIYLASLLAREGSWHLQTFNEKGELIRPISLKLREPINRDYRRYLTDIGIDGQGNIYILARLRKNEEFKSKVQKFNPEGKILMEFGEKGKGDGEFHAPGAMTVDREGHIYITGLHKIQKFDNKGRFIRIFKSPREEDPEYLGHWPRDIEVDREGNIYVLVMDREIEEERKIWVSRVKKFDFQGNLLMSIGGREKDEEDFWLADEIAVDREGHIYVVDHMNRRIQVFNSQGEFLRSIKHNPFMIKWFKESIIGWMLDKVSRPSRVVELKK